MDYELINDPDYKKSGKGNKPKDDSHQDIHDIFDEVSSDSDGKTEHRKDSITGQAGKSRDDMCQIVNE